MIGTLLRDTELEGGFWYIALAQPKDSADASRVVLANPGTFTGLSDLERALVVAEGSIGQGASIRMAGPELVADSVSRIEAIAIESGERALTGVPPRWARVEKPGLHREPNGTVRVVGVLTYARDAEGGAGAWVVLNEMPFGGGTPRTSAVLSSAEFGEPGNPEWDQSYVAVTGEVIGAVGVGNATIPKLRVLSTDIVTDMKPTAEERFR